MLANKTQPKPICYSTPICFISDGQTIEPLNWLVRLIVPCAFHLPLPLPLTPLLASDPPITTHNPFKLLPRAHNMLNWAGDDGDSCCSPRWLIKCKDYDGKDYEDDDAMK